MRAIPLALATWLWAWGTAAMTLPSHHEDVSFTLLARQDSTCGGDSNLSPCGGKRPSNWCCPKTTTCLSLNNTGTQAVICCPNGNDCNTIQTITCDMSFQDATKFPSSSVHSANLTLGLPACGNQCCPLGFSCSTSTTTAPFCRMLDSTKAPDASNASTTPSTSPSATSVKPTNSAATSATSDGPPSTISKGAIIAIVVPLVIAGLAIVLFLFWCKKSKSKKQISGPIYDPEMSARTDFLNRYRARHTGAHNTPSQQDMGNRFDRPSTATSARPLVPRQPSQAVPIRFSPGNTPPVTRMGTPDNQINRGGSPSSRTGSPPVNASAPPPKPDYYGTRVLPSVPGRQSPSRGAGQQGYTLPPSRFSG